MGTHLNEKQTDKLRRLIISKQFSNQEIAEIIGCGQSTIQYHKRMLKDEHVIEEPEVTESEWKCKWLRMNWKFAVNKDKKESKYRVVHSGERARLRTPYRPDGRF